MRKYCLTKCFKRKMSDGWETILNYSMITLTLLGMLLGIVLVCGGIGWIAVHLGIELKENMDYFTLGLVIIMGTLIFGWSLHWIFVLIRSVSESLSSFVKERYEGEPYECSIFEECKEEPVSDKDFMRGD